MRAYRRHNAKGFTLVEIMIVVAIIALIAAVAIPNMLRARHNANETAAIASLRGRTLTGRRDGIPEARGARMSMVRRTCTVAATASKTISAR